VTDGVLCSLAHLGTQATTDIHKEIGPVIYDIMGKRIFGGEWLQGYVRCALCRDIPAAQRLCLWAISRRFSDGVPKAACGRACGAARRR
jgi:hypothetical protein